MINSRSACVKERYAAQHHRGGKLKPFTLIKAEYWELIMPMTPCLQYYHLKWNWSAGCDSASAMWPSLRWRTTHYNMSWVAWYSIISQLSLNDNPWTVNVIHQFLACAVRIAAYAIFDIDWRNELTLSQPALTACSLIFKQQANIVV